MPPPPPPVAATEPSLWGGDETAVPTDDLTASQATMAMRAILAGQSVDDVVALVLPELPSGAAALADTSTYVALEESGQEDNARGTEASAAKSTQGLSTAVTSSELKEDVDLEFDAAPVSHDANAWENTPIVPPSRSDATGNGVPIPRLNTLQPGAAAVSTSPPKPVLLEDVKFHPNIINTVVFLVSASMQACTVRQAN